MTLQSIPMPRPHSNYIILTLREWNIMLQDDKHEQGYGYWAARNNSRIVYDTNVHVLTTAKPPWATHVLWYTK